MPLQQRPPLCLTHLRTFTSSTRTHSQSSNARLAREHSAVPPYPYGSSKTYKQSNFGLYGEQKIRFGNSVSEKNEIKNRRLWRPNVQSKRFWSEALQRRIKVRVTTRVLRTIDKCGGLDGYLLGEKPQRVKELGMAGWKLRWRILQTDAVKERFRVQREVLGLEPTREEGLVGADGGLITEEQVREEIRKFDEELERDAEMDIGEVEEAGVLEEQIGGKEKILV